VPAQARGCRLRDGLRGHGLHLARPPSRTGAGRTAGALALGCLLASPLFAAHLAAGCSWTEALLFSRGDYLRSGSGWSSFGILHRVLALAGPIALAGAAAGAATLWREHRAVAWVAAAVVLLYANELWLAPLGARTTLNLLRGLTIFAFPVAAAAGVFLAARPRAARALIAACALWALGCAWLAIPGSCHRAPVDFAQASELRIDRCQFRWAVRTPR
jgi:hypothetical protein